MASGFRLSAWAALAALLALGAMLAQCLPTAGLDWQPVQAWAEPWRFWSAAFVHWSSQHLLANLAGCAVLALLGWAARLPARAALAWALAWPLTQAGLLLRPDLMHYGGLSGVLHAGVAVAVLELLRRPGRERLVALAIALGLIVKLSLEQPLGPALRVLPGWDILIAPVAHLSGAVSGAVMGALIGAIGALASPRCSRWAA
ncbi:rhombosortase [Paucibacter sp. PLA-PC-4]|uniref:rhombosortase n=1 Tax=Paucibacter sp. PLA-PC-4 TaxID=2993655 RepID=UPI00224AC56D|nr:rhombosortase [Paucibacter sp. PLA-PC-4]MCX2863950.1 rhombosortase [Paucibacter sp. PLA-PC-4]